MPPKQIRLYSTKDAAIEVGVSVPRVKQLRRDLGVGRIVGRSLVFTEHDLDRMRQRNTSPGPKGPRRPSANEEH